MPQVIVLGALFSVWLRQYLKYGKHSKMHHRVWFEENTYDDIDNDPFGTNYFFNQF